MTHSRADGIPRTSPVTDARTLDDIAKAVAPLLGQGNGRNGQRGEFLRWLIGVSLAAIVAYFTTINAIQSEVGEIRAKQESQFNEVLRAIDVLRQDVRDLRSGR